MTWQGFPAILKGGHRTYPLNWNGDRVDELAFAPPSDEGILNEKPALIAMSLSPEFYRFRAGNFINQV